MATFILSPTWHICLRAERGRRPPRVFSGAGDAGRDKNVRTISSSRYAPVFDPRILCVGFSGQRLCEELVPARRSTRSVDDGLWPLVAIKIGLFAAMTVIAAFNKFFLTRGCPTAGAA